MNGIEAPWIGDPDYGHVEKINFEDWYSEYGADRSEESEEDEE